MLQFLQWMLAGIAVLILPGAAWLAWSARPARPGKLFAVQLADAVGISISITALVALLTFLIPFQISGDLLLALAVILLGVTVAGLLFKTEIRLTRGFWITLALLAIAAGWRFYQARSLVLPAWVDSVHHVLIVQAILQRGGLPADLSPYLPVPMYYHYGFHALAAEFAALSELPAEKAVLVLGQVLNALVGLSVFRFGMALWADWRRSAAAGLLVTFALHMPAYYLTWGRYTLLTGLILLPLGMATAVEAVDEERRSIESLARLAILTAGLFLTHYLAALLFGIFLALLGIGRLWRNIRSRRAMWPGWINLAGGVALGTAAAAPWIYRVWVYSSSAFNVEAVVAPNAPNQVYFSGYGSYLWYLAGPLRNQVLLGIALVGVFFSIARPRSRVLGAWGLLLGLLSLPWGLKLGPFRPDLILIVLFFPAALLISDLAAGIGSAASRWKGWLRWALPAAVIAAACIWGIRETRDILNPGTVFASQDDTAALRWIDGNTPTSARFFINTAPWQGPIYRGTDGGWWILPITGRQTLLPPVLYSWGSADFVNRINQLAGQASKLNSCGPAFWQVVREDRLDYAYLHDGLGSLASGALQNCPGADRVFQSGAVSIYQLHPPEQK